MKSEGIIDQATHDRVKRKFYEMSEFNIDAWAIRDALGASEWTPEYVEKLRKSSPDPNHLAQVELFDKTRNAYVTAIKGNETEKAKPLKALAYKSFHKCYMDIGMIDKATEMKKKYEEIRNQFILG